MEHGSLGAAGAGGARLKRGRGDGGAEGCEKCRVLLEFGWEKYSMDIIICSSRIASGFTLIGYFFILSIM